MRRALAWAVCALVAAGCEPDLERMTDQERYDPYEPNPYFADGTTMQHPPPGTIPRGEPLVAPEVAEGVRENRPVAEMPVAVSPALLQRGRNRYDIFCSPCHGIDGEARTQVAENMRLRPPPPLVRPPVRGFPPGRIYQAITYGFGLMPTYASYLPISDRWAVVAYVQALQISRQVALDALPGDVHEEAASWLK